MIKNKFLIKESTSNPKLDFLELKEYLSKNTKNPIPFLNDLLIYLKKTNEDDWIVGLCRNNLNQNCLIGHVCNFIQSKFPEESKQDNNYFDYLIFEWFEYNIASPYQYYLVNDGKHQNYPQKTPKQRCCAYILDLINGDELLIKDYMDLFNLQQFNKLGIA